MRVGLLGTGAIAHKHAEAYARVGFTIQACSNRNEDKGRRFAGRWGARFLPDWRELCTHPDVDYVDVCTFPDAHLSIVEHCADARKPVLLQKPIAADLTSARAIVTAAANAGITLGVMSQHRFDDSIVFLNRALAAGRLGRLLQADAYVKWYRSPEYYARPGKGAWDVEGGGALINQAIHQVDLLLYLAGPVQAVSAAWQLGALHQIPSEDIVNAVLQFRSGATGVLQASTAFWPGSPERLELHGTLGTAVITGDRLTCWKIADDVAVTSAPAPVAELAASGASDPMAIGLESFERQFLDFASAVRERRPPLVDGEEGYRALQLVTAIYTSCSEARFVQLSS